MHGNLGYLFAGYTILWAIIFIYVFFIGKKQGDLKREIDELRKIAEERHEV